jgi:hypothetical protein
MLRALFLFHTLRAPSLERLEILQRSCLSNTIARSQPLRRGHYIPPAPIESTRRRHCLLRVGSHDVDARLTPVNFHCTIHLTNHLIYQPEGTRNNSTQQHASHAAACTG